MHLFSFRKLFVTCSYCFFSIREKRGGRGGRGENALSVKSKSIELCCSQETMKELS